MALIWQNPLYAAWFKVVADQSSFNGLQVRHEDALAGTLAVNAYGRSTVASCRRHCSAAFFNVYEGSSVAPIYEESAKRRS